MSPTDDAEGRDLRGRFTHNENPPPRAPKGVPKKTTFFKHYKVDELLPDEHKDAYEKLMRDPRSTVPILQKFLRDIGINVSRAAVANHRTAGHIEEKRAKEASLMARAFCDLVRAEGANNVAEASHSMFEMTLMEFLFKDENAPLLSPEQLEQIGKVTQRAIKTRMDCEELREGCERREIEKEKARRPKMSRREASLETVRRVEEILGLRRPIPPNPPATPSDS
jgi:hypothetical protein